MLSFPSHQYTVGSCKGVDKIDYLQHGCVLSRFRFDQTLKSTSTERGDIENLPH